MKQKYPSQTITPCEWYFFLVILLLCSDNRHLLETFQYAIGCLCVRLRNNHSSFLAVITWPSWNIPCHTLKVWTLWPQTLLWDDPRKEHVVSLLRDRVDIIWYTVWKRMLQESVWEHGDGTVRLKEEPHFEMPSLRSRAQYRTVSPFTLY
jgi:hypothetical protein